MYKRVNVLKLIVAIAIPLAIGMVSSFITKDAMMSFNAMKKPQLSPPGILFPIVWSILYVLMGLSSYIIYSFNPDNNIFLKKARKEWIVLYSIQLVFNFIWSIIFFKFSLYFMAFIWLLILWVLVMILIINSMKLNRLAGYLLVPYLIWITFAGYLNIGVAILNK